MKKTVVIACSALLLLLILALVAGFVFMDILVKRGVETVGPRVTKVDTKLDGAHISVFSGAGSLKGFFLGNPQGYKSPSAIQVGKVTISLEPRSVFGSKVIVHTINVEAPEITFEGTLGGNNLNKILANVQAYTGGGASGQKEDKAAARKIQVDDFLISAGKVHLAVNIIGTQTLTVPLPEIHMTALGTGPDGITMADLTEKVFKAMLAEITPVVTKALSNLGKGAVDAASGAAAGATDQAGKAVKDIGGLFKKKQ